MGFDFCKNGFGPVFEVRQHVLEMLEWSSPPKIFADLPSYTQFQHCFPTGRYIPFVQLLSGVVPKSERPAKRVRASAELATDQDDSEEPWSKRLRPRLRGRVIRAKAKPNLIPGGATPAPPRASTILEPAGHMMSSSGHTLTSLRRFPIRRRPTHAALPEEMSGS